jgi:hypothetical protein
MRFAAFDGETRISDLVDRLFVVPEGSPPALRKSVEKALREANPQLGNLRQVPTGAPILVPEVPGVAPSGDVAPVTAHLGDLLGSLATPVAAAKASIDASLRLAAERHDQIIDLLRSRELRDQAQEDAELRERLDQLATVANDRLGERKALAERRARTMAALDKDLEALARDPGALPSALTPGSPG